MTRLFVSLFVALALGLFLIKQTGEWLYQTFSADAHTSEWMPTQLLAEPLTKLLKAPKDIGLRQQWRANLESQLDQASTLVAVDDIALLPEQQSSLNQGQLISYADHLSQHYILLPYDSEHFLQLGPFGPSESMPQNSPLAMYLYIFSYFLLALLVLIWSRPLWHDLNKLANETRSIANGQYDITLQVTRTSVVYPLAKAMEQMSHKIRDLLTLQKQMTHAVSHDIRTPLARLKFSLALINAEKDQCSEVTTEMSQDIAEIELLIDEMLTYGRLESDAIELTYEEVNLRELTANLVSKLNRTNAQKIELDCPLAISFHCDGHLLERALQNILVNAQRYAQSKVSFKVNETANGVKLVIEDDGPGIAEKELQAVFKPFVRIEASRNKASGGFGLGLAIVHKIVTWHKGTVTAEQAAENGARFVVFLPKRV